MDNKLETFKSRLRRVGVEIELVGNIPWIYLHSINGVAVKEKFMANHGFTVAFYNGDVEFTDITEIFKLIRSYKNRQ